MSRHWILNAWMLDVDDRAVVAHMLRVNVLGIGNRYAAMQPSSLSGQMTLLLYLIVVNLRELNLHSMLWNIMRLIVCFCMLGTWLQCLFSLPLTDWLVLNSKLLNPKCWLSLHGYTQILRVWEIHKLKSKARDFSACYSSSFSVCIIIMATDMKPMTGLQSYFHYLSVTLTGTKEWDK